MAAIVFSAVFPCVSSCRSGCPTEGLVFGASRNGLLDLFGHLSESRRFCSFARAEEIR